MANLKNAASDHLMRADLSELRVLLVDRHTHARDSLRMMLSSLGVTKVHGAASTVEVLRQVKANSFDIIFSDYVLEDGRDGQQLLEELRLKHLIALTTVFIIVTSERGYHNVVSLAELTPDDYLIKPFTADQLETRLGRAFYRKHVLAPILRHMDATSYNKALAACELVLEKGDEMFLEAQRLKGEILNLLGRHADAEKLFREVLATRPLPWAKMGLAIALRARKDLEEAGRLANELIKEHPHFLAAHDFLAKVLEESGDSAAAQKALVIAAEMSPHNTLRQRIVGDIAVRNGDLAVAEKAYQTTLNRTRGSSLATVDDYANLSRVLLDTGKVAMARSVANDLRRERKWDAASEVTALIVDSLCHKEEGDEAGARAALDKALAAREALAASGNATASPLSEKIAVDLAHACLATGQADKGKEILRQVAAEHQDNPAILGRMEQVFDKTDHSEVGKELLQEVSKEIIAINNRGVLMAREGNLEGSVELLSQAADRIPNVQFLVNAASAIFTLLDRQGWRPGLAERGLSYLVRAQQRDPKNPRVIAVGELFQHVAHKNNISVPGVRQHVIAKLKAAPAGQRG